MRSTIVYSGSFTATEGAVGAGAFRTLVLNGLWDSDTAFGNTASVGYAEAISLYKSYRVLRTRVKATAFAKGMSAGGIARITFNPDVNSTVMPSNPELWPTQQNACCKVVARTEDGGNNRAEIDRTFNLPTLFNVRPAVYNSESNYAAVTVNSNPTYLAYGKLGIASIGSSAVATMVATILIAYDVEFFNPYTTLTG
jgi:hypothetical protein